MKVISILTQKGGVGKTTATIHIGGSLALVGYKVLLIDFDTQKNLSIGLNVSDNTGYNIQDFLELKQPPKFTVRGKNDQVFLLEGSSMLSEENLKNNSLKTAISKIENDFDFVIIDCPPKPINKNLSLGEIAVFASDYIICPIKADKYSIAGISSLLSAVNHLKEKFALKARILGFFFNEVEENTSHFNYFYTTFLNSQAGEYLLKNYIRKDAIVRFAKVFTSFYISENEKNFMKESV